jgi:hypothetical protein
LRAVSFWLFFLQPGGKRMRLGNYADAAGVLKMKPGTLQQWCSAKARRPTAPIFPRGVLLKIGGMVRFNLDLLEQWAASQASQASQAMGEPPKATTPPKTRSRKGKGK